jgi:hypothetical protein
MQESKVFWEYFLATGNIGAYLIFREVNADKLLRFKLLMQKGNRDLI